MESTQCKKKMLFFFYPFLKKASSKNGILIQSVDIPKKGGLSQKGSNSESNLLSILKVSLKDSSLKQNQLSPESHTRSNSQKQPNKEDPYSYSERLKKSQDQNKMQLLSQLVTKVEQKDTPFSGQRQLKLPNNSSSTTNLLNVYSSLQKSQLIQKPPTGRALTRQVKMQNFQPSEILKQSELIRIKGPSLTPTLRPHQNNVQNYFEARQKYNDSQEKQKIIICDYYLKQMQEAFTRSLSLDYFQKIFRDHFYQTYQGIYYTQFIKPLELTELKTKRLILPKDEKYKNKISLIFDLDETLVHCNENLSIPSDVILQIQVSKTDKINAGINIRPGARSLLEDLVNDFEIIVFTASHQCYAQKVLEQIDPTGKIIQFAIFRDNCVMTSGGMYTKDLRIFSDRSLDQLVLIDNASYSYAFQLDNGIPIIPYYDNKQDTQLDSLKNYLRGMIGCKDVRAYNRKHLKLHMFNDQQGPQKVFEKLFGHQMEG